MEFLQGIGSKTGAMPLSDDLMYIFHIRPEVRDAVFKRQDYPDLFKQRLSQYGSYVADVAASLDANSDIVYSPIEPMLLPWPWFRGRVVLGGDAAHTFPPHLTQGAAMAAEDGYVLAREALADDVPLDGAAAAVFADALCALRLRVHVLVPMDGGRTIVRTPEDLAAARLEWRRTHRRASPPATVSSTARLFSGRPARLRNRAGYHALPMSAKRSSIDTREQRPQ